MRRLFDAVDNLVLCRIRAGWGAVAAVHWGMLLLTGKAEAEIAGWAAPIPYIGFEWLVRLSPAWMMGLVWTAFVCAILVAVGLFYRVAMPVLLGIWAYVLWHDIGMYSNFSYISILTGFWLMLGPAAGRVSLDAKLFPGHRTNETPVWVLWMLRFQVGVAYFYGGVIKFNSDWMAGEPLGPWLAESSHWPVIGEWLTWRPLVLGMSWAGLFFDLTIAFWLLWPRARPLALGAAVFFHITNYILLSVGFLPFMMIVVTGAFWEFSGRRARPVAKVQERALLALMAVWVITQTLVPLRHHLYPGDGRITYEGQRYSWWWRHARQEVKAKVWVEVDGVRQAIHPPDYLNPAQYSLVSDPHALVIWAHWLKTHPDFGGRVTGVFAHVEVSLNGHPFVVLVPEDVDLSALPITLRHYDFL